MERDEFKALKEKLKQYVKTEGNDKDLNDNELFRSASSLYLKKLERSQLGIGDKADYFDNIEKYRRELLKNYEGKSLEDSITGKNIKNSEGECYLIQKSEDFNLPTISIDNLKNSLLTRLDLIYGIREEKVKNFQKKGFRTLRDLVRHPNYRNESKQILSIIESNNPHEILNLLNRRFQKSHPFSFAVSGFFSPKDYIFVDIETLGLGTVPIILFGIAEYEEGKIFSYQYFVRNLGEEPAAIYECLKHFGNKKVVFSYNGKMFDIPYIRERAMFYGLDCGNQLGELHFDLLHYSRNRWKLGLQDHKFGTIEKHILKCNRGIDIPSEFVPDFYLTYEREQNCGVLIPIIEHNYNDIVNLVKLYGTLSESWEKNWKK